MKVVGKMEGRHPFTTMGATIIDKISKTGEPFDFEQYKRQNYTVLLAWKPKEALYRDASKTGFPWLLHMSAIRPDALPAFQERLKKIVEKFPGNVGFIINDEPQFRGRNNFEDTGKVLNWIKQTWPEKLVLSNTNAHNIGALGDKPGDYFGSTKGLTPEEIHDSKRYTYDDYVRDYVRLVRPDVLMFDGYIFSYGEGNETGVPHEWFEALWVIRREALWARIPYWAWMQTWDRPAERGYNVRLPSESDYRMEVFSALTYGFTGTSDFIYCGGHVRDILLQNGTPSPLFEPAAKTHAEVRNIGQSLRFLTSTNVAFLPGYQPDRKPWRLERPYRLADWAPKAGGDSNITYARVVDGDVQRNGLIGHFVDDDGQTYFMVTNLYQHAHKSAAEAAVKFRLKFAPEVKTVLRLSRETGKTERLEIKDAEQGLLVTLPGGTGDLFKYDTGPFAGVTE